VEKAGKYFSLNANYTLSHTLDDGTFVTFVSTPQSTRSGTWSAPIRIRTPGIALWQILPPMRAEFLPAQLPVEQHYHVAVGTALYAVCGL